ncbi:MAG: glycoside hydrolase family 32 protein [Flavobacteriaceae bacterium]
MRSTYVALFVLFFSCKEKISDKNNAVPVVNTKEKYTEPFRPQFHFSPPEKWMNDPNGLVVNNGVYHLFYQYYPEDIVWGPMHWGHAVSNDLIQWEHKPIALYPDEHGLIFSGSAVIDKFNTSGFGTKENPPLVAIFTYHLMEGEKAGRTNFQTQGIAYSLDNGDTWTKYKVNPVIGNSGIKDFRDPKVFWDETNLQWVLTLVAGDHAKFYTSKNLKEWVLTGEFGNNKGAHGGVWECPDLFPLKVEGTEEEKWVLLISINPGAPNGGSGTQYFVGEFDGKTFTTSQTETKWLDYGMDNYAGVTYNNAPNNERIFIGWMSNWNYAQDTPTEIWRSAMTLPRKISLYKRDSGYFLKNYPISSLNTIETLVDSIYTSALPYSRKSENYNKTDISFIMNLSKELKVTYSNENSEKIVLSFQPYEGKITFDRTNSGIIDFKESFGKEIQSQPYFPLEKEVEVRVVIDQSSVEIFIDKGAYVFTNQIFPKAPYTNLEISSSETLEIKSLNIHKIKSIWNE